MNTIKRALRKLIQTNQKNIKKIGVKIGKSTTLACRLQTTS
jgi:hypothetical protein